MLIISVSIVNIDKKIFDNDFDAVTSRKNNN